MAASVALSTPRPAAAVRPGLSCSFTIRCPLRGEDRIASEMSFCCARHTMLTSHNKTMVPSTSRPPSTPGLSRKRHQLAPGRVPGPERPPSAGVVVLRPQRLSRITLVPLLMRRPALARLMHCHGNGRPRNAHDDESSTIVSGSTLTAQRIRPEGQSVPPLLRRSCARWRGDGPQRSTVPPRSLPRLQPPRARPAPGTCSVWAAPKPHPRCIGARPSDRSARGRVGTRVTSAIGLYDRRAEDQASAIS